MQWVAACGKVQKLLGQKFVLAVMDEAQACTIDLRQLVYGVLKPAMADYRGTVRP